VRSVTWRGHQYPSGPSRPLPQSRSPQYSTAQLPSRPTLVQEPSTSAPGGWADTSGGRMWPSVRRLLAESGLDPRGIAPTGPLGMLVKGDVLAAMGLCVPPATVDVLVPVGLPAQPTTTASAPAAAAPAAVAPAAAARTPPPPSPPPLSPGHDFADLPVSNVRKDIASRLVESKSTGPHAYVTADVSLAGVAALRAELNAGGVRASVNDCVVYAAVGPGRCCWPRQQTHIEPSFLELNGIP